MIEGGLTILTFSSDQLVHPLHSEPVTKHVDASTAGVICSITCDFVKECAKNKFVCRQVSANFFTFLERADWFSTSRRQSHTGVSFAARVRFDSEETKTVGTKVIRDEDVPV